MDDITLNDWPPADLDVNLPADNQHIDDDEPMDIELNANDEDV